MKPNIFEIFRTFSRYVEKKLGISRNIIRRFYVIFVSRATRSLTFSMPCLVPVRRFPSPTRSIRFGDVSEVNGRETPSHFRMDHVTRKALVTKKIEA